jgi:hypothetical protein
MKQESDYHPMVKTHKCVKCGNMVREFEWLNKYMGPCGNCGGTLYPIELDGQDTAWKGKP